MRGADLSRESGRHGVPPLPGRRNGCVATKRAPRRCAPGGGAADLPRYRQSPPSRVERSAPRRVRPPPRQTVRAVFPHTAFRVGLVSSVSLPFASRLRFTLIPMDAPPYGRAVFTLIPMDAPPYGRAVSDAPPHSGLSPIAVFRHYCSRHLICIVPFARRGPSHPRALPRFPATTTSSDSSVRFRYNEVSQVPD